MADTFKFAQLQNFSLNGSGVIIGATSITLKSMTDIDGNALSMTTDFGSIGFGTLEPGNGANEEQISFTGLVNNSNGTVTLTGVSNVSFLYPYTQTSGLSKTHAGSTPFIISNTSGFYDRLSAKADDETITGTWTFTNPNYPQMDTATPAPTTNVQFATKKYVDDTAIAGAPNASDVTIGITKLSLAATSPANPISVGDNDPRVPTQGENDALVGTSGTPSSSNKYVTNDDVASAATASKVARRNATGDVTVPTTPTAGTDAGSKTYIDAADTVIAGTVTNITNNSINALGTSATWNTTHIVPPYLPVSGNTPWTMTGSTTNALYGNGSQVQKTNTSVSAYVDIANFKIGATQAALSFADLPQLSTKFNATIYPGTGTTSPHNWTFIGYFTGSPTVNDGNITSVTTPRLGIAAYNGNLYFLVSDGVTNTTVTIGTYSAVAGKEITITQTGTTTATLYVNGVAQTAITTHLPTTGAMRFGISADSDTGGVTGVALISGITYSQLL